MKDGGFYLTSLWGFVHVWKANICTFYMITFLLLEEREDIVTESNFCNKDYVLYCWYIYMLLNMIMGYSKHPCQSSKRCKLVCKRSSVWDFTSVLMEDVKENWMSFFTSSIPLWGCLTWSLTGSHGRLLSYIKLKLLTGSLAVPILIAKCRFLTI